MNLRSRKFTNSIDIEENVKLGINVKIYSNSCLRAGSSIGSDVIIGRGVYIGPGVKIGNRVKIQNNAQIFEPAVIEDEVFIGPGVILTNDKNPRATTVLGDLKNQNDWEKVGVVLKKGCSIGAGTVCVGPLQVGSYAMVGANSVITKDCEDFSLTYGNPSKSIGWVGKDGYKLKKENGYYVDTKGNKYSNINNEEGIEILIALKPI